MRRILLALGLCAAGGGAVHAETPFLGEVITVAFDFCPNGYAPMNGQLVFIAQNTALFSLLGTTYGGNGTTNFALPTAKPVFTATRATFTQCIALQGIYPTRN